MDINNLILNSEVNQVSENRHQKKETGNEFNILVKVQQFFRVLGAYERTDRR